MAHKYLQHWVGLDQPVFDTIHLASMATALCQVLQQIFGCL